MTIVVQRIEIINLVGDWQMVKNSDFNSANYLTKLNKTYLTAILRLGTSW